MRRAYLLIPFILCWTGQLVCQEDNPFGSIDDIVFNDWEDPTNTGVNRHHQELEWHYRGYFVELSNSIDPLPRSFEVFERFGIIHIDELHDGRYSYGIKASFNKKKEAVRYFRDIVKKRIVDARLYFYVKGKRKRIRV